jgi:formate hydrogenlyase transcriptional activator
LTVASRSIDLAETSRLAIEALPSGVLIADVNGTIALVNRELERQFGYTRAELVGQNVDLVLPEASNLIHAAHPAGFAHASSAPGMGAGRERFGRRKDGSPIQVEIGLRPVQLADNLFVLASVVDTTERDQLERVRQAALEEQLEFERFVAELSGQFINLHGDRIDEAIRSGLGRICAQLGLDRGSFYKIGPDGELFDCVAWVAPGVPPVEGPMPAQDRLPWALGRIRAGEVVSFSTRDNVPSDVDRASYAALGIRSAVVVPLSVGDRIEGAVGFNAVREDRSWPPEVVHRLKVVAGVFAQLVARQRRDEALRAATAEAQRLKEQLQSENVYLRREARERLGPSRAVGQGAAVRQVLEQIEQVAATDSTVLLLGETGTGKELFATQIHELSDRHGRAMVRVNCAAIPATLIESELFGREKGAFTGALARQVGRFELADHSTIFLDEIGDLPLDVQVKLLRVLEERQIERLGSPRPITVDTRIIAATHRNLEQRIAEGLFREDLYYRLSVFPIHVPPLRERVEDIPLLVWRFVEEFSKAFGKRVDSIDKDNLVALQQYAWPGNIRELRNVVERAMIGATGLRLTIALPQPTPAASRRSAKLVDVEREHIRSVLEGTGWRIRGPGGAAERLGMKPTTLETRMAKLGLRRPGNR